MKVVLERYEHVPAQLDEYKHMVNSKRETYFWLLTLDLGLRSINANLEWAENVIDMLKSGKVPAQ
jgi:Virulence activator alpha C-term